MPIPQVNDRIKEAPMVVLRAVFAGIGQILLTADKVRARAAEQVWTPERTTAPGPASQPGMPSSAEPHNGTGHAEPAVAAHESVRAAAPRRETVVPPTARATAKATPTTKATSATRATAKATPTAKATAKAPPAPKTAKPSAAAKAGKSTAAGKGTAAAKSASPKTADAKTASPRSADAKTTKPAKTTDAKSAKAAPTAPAATPTTPSAKSTNTKAKAAPKAKLKPAPIPAPRAAAAEPATEAPLAGYDELTLASLRARLRALDAATVQAMLAYEQAHARREPVITMLERRLVKITPGNTAG